VKSASTKFLVSAILAPALILPYAIHAQSQSDNVDTARNIIEVGYSSHDPTVRVEAIAATGMIAKSDAVRKRIEGFLADKDANVRIAATETLGDLGFQESIPALENTFKNDPVPEVQFAAAKALYRLHDPKGKQALEDVINGTIGTKSSVVDQQKRRFLSSFSSFHGATIYLLSTGGGFVPVPGAGVGLGEVARIMNDSALSPRATAVLLLGRDRGPDIDNILRTALGDKDPTVRASAAVIIALTARRDMRENIAPLLDDNDQKVRFRAAGAYLHLVGAAPPQAEK
jgi:HEAT repeat protein